MDRVLRIVEQSERLRINLQDIQQRLFVQHPSLHPSLHPSHLADSPSKMAAQPSPAQRSVLPVCGNSPSSPYPAAAAVQTLRRRKLLKSATRQFLRDQKENIGPIRHSLKPAPHQVAPAYVPYPAAFYRDVLAKRGSGQCSTVSVINSAHEAPAFPRYKDPEEFYDHVLLERNKLTGSTASSNSKLSDHYTALQCDPHSVCPYGCPFSYRHQTPPLNSVPRCNKSPVCNKPPRSSAGSAKKTPTAKSNFRYFPSTDVVTRCIRGAGQSQSGADSFVFQCSQTTSIWPASPASIWPASPASIWPASPAPIWPASPATPRLHRKPPCVPHKKRIGAQRGRLNATPCEYSSSLSPPRRHNNTTAELSTSCYSRDSVFPPAPLRHGLSPVESDDSIVTSLDDISVISQTSRRSFSRDQASTGNLKGALHSTFSYPLHSTVIASRPGGLDLSSFEESLSLDDSQNCEAATVTTTFELTQHTVEQKNAWGDQCRRFGSAIDHNHNDVALGADKGQRDSEGKGLKAAESEGGKDGRGLRRQVAQTWLSPRRDPAVSLFNVSEADERCSTAASKVLLKDDVEYNNCDTIQNFGPTSSRGGIVSRGAWGDGNASEPSIDVDCTLTSSKLAQLGSPATFAETTNAEEPGINSPQAKRTHEAMPVIARNHDVIYAMANHAGSSRRHVTIPINHVTTPKRHGVTSPLRRPMTRQYKRSVALRLGSFSRLLRASNGACCGEDLVRLGDF